MNHYFTYSLRAIAGAGICGVLLLSPFARADFHENETTNALGAGTNDASARVHATGNKSAKGEPKALFELSRTYARGLGVPKDPVKAVQYAREAAEEGYPPAQTALGSFYGRGLGVPQNIVEAITWYRKAADQGYPLAQYALGTFYETGKGVPTNIDLAVQWLRKAADQGQSAAQCELGQIYFNGIKDDPNHPIDFDEAVKWLKKAASQGFIGAMNNLGLAYASGLGGLPLDPETGAKWLLQAADHGNPKAQASLGEMYRTGRGVPRDLVQAYVWLRLAEEAGNIDGKHSAKEVARILSPTEITKADEMIEYFQAHHQAKTAIEEAKQQINSGKPLMHSYHPGLPIRFLVS